MMPVFVGPWGFAFSSAALAEELRKMDGRRRGRRLVFCGLVSVPGIRVVGYTPRGVSLTWAGVRVRRYVRHLGASR